MLSFSSQRFKDLEKLKLYEILALRASVFVVEQNCAYQDLDGKDTKAIHLMGHSNGELVAYARVLDKGVSYDNYVSIGRIVTRSEHRGKNYGHKLVAYALEECRKRFSGQPVKISAQAHLEEFYNTHGFTAEGKPYLEDDIPHIAMVCNQKG